MRRVLITGAAGFIGAHLAKTLAEDAGVALTLIDDFSRGKRDADFTTLLGRPRISFIEADLTDSGSFAKLAEPFDQIYHLAAVNGTKNFYLAPSEVLRVNTLSTVGLLDWIADMSVKPKVMFTSTCETYAGALETFGQLPLPTPEDVPLVVGNPYNARWSYGGSKIVNELFFIHYAQRHHIPTVIVRPHNFYGPRDGDGHVIPDLIDRIMKRAEPFPIFGADQTRSFCFIDDAVWGMIGLMNDAGIGADGPETFNIGSTQETRMDALAEMLFGFAAWRPERLDRRDAPKGSVTRRLGDVSKIAARTGWAASTTLADGLRRTFEWYRAARL